VKPAPFAYCRADSVEEALALLAEHGDEAKLLSGGQSLVPLLNMRLAQPALVVDISRVAELRAVSEHDAVTRYGSALTHASFEDGKVPDAAGGLLAHVAGGIGYRAIRNKGTLGGSLAHADSSAEWPVVMSALGARVVLRSARRGERAVPAADFVEGFLTSALDDDEAIVAVEVPRLSPTARWGFAKTARKPGEFAESLAVALVRTDGDGRIAGADVWLGAAVPVPLALPSVGDVLPGRRWDEAAAADAGAATEADLAVAGHTAPSELDLRYERRLHAVTAVRALQHALVSRGDREEAA
jgi:carbon-monoxide dehydrogenase medium subunit